MQHKKRSRSFGRRTVVAAITAGTVFQVSSCNIDGNGVISAFADPGALAELRNQLLEASPLGRLFDHVNVDVQIGNDE